MNKNSNFQKRMTDEEMYAIIEKKISEFEITDPIVTAIKQKCSEMEVTDEDVMLMEKRTFCRFWASEIAGFSRDETISMILSFPKFPKPFSKWYNKLDRSPVQLKMGSIRTRSEPEKGGIYIEWCDKKWNPIKKGRFRIRPGVCYDIDTDLVIWS
jgi:hypothetical protein